MRKVREVIRQNQYAGLSQRQIANATGGSRPVVREYLRWFASSGLNYEDITAMSDSELNGRIAAPQGSARRDKDRYEALRSRIDGYLKDLGKKGVTRELLRREYRRAVPDGYSYTQFFFYLQLHAQSDEVLPMHLEHTPGEQLFIDYAGTGPKLYELRGAVEREMELFVATLPASATYFDGSATRKSR